MKSDENDYSWMCKNYSSHLGEVLNFLVCAFLCLWDPMTPFFNIFDNYVDSRVQITSVHCVQPISDTNDPQSICEELECAAKSATITQVNPYVRGVGYLKDHRKVSKRQMSQKLHQPHLSSFTSNYARGFLMYCVVCSVSFEHTTLYIKKHLASPSINFNVFSIHRLKLF